VLALAESVSIQSVTLTLQNLQSGSIHWGQFGRALFQEALTATMIGAACGSVVALTTWVWKREPLVSGILAVSITASMLMACVFGVLFPTLLRAARADPKIAAGPIVLALTDLATLLFYFTVAGMLLTSSLRRWQTNAARYATARGITSSSRVSTAIRGSHSLSIARNFRTRSGSNSSPARSSM
jgi:Mg/Co/Ni transporter MgtE